MGRSLAADIRRLPDGRPDWEEMAAAILRVIAGLTDPPAMAASCVRTAKSSYSGQNHLVRNRATEEDRLKSLSPAVICASLPWTSEDHRTAHPVGNRDSGDAAALSPVSDPTQRWWL
jgi:hypothetical protein